MEGQAASISHTLPLWAAKAKFLVSGWEVRSAIPSPRLHSGGGDSTQARQAECPGALITFTPTHYWGGNSMPGGANWEDQRLPLLSSAQSIDSFFSPGDRLSVRTDIYIAFPRGIDFIWNRVWGISSLKSDVLKNNGDFGDKQLKGSWHVCKRPKPEAIWFSRENQQKTVKKSPPGARTNVKNCPPKILLKRGSNPIRSDCRTIYAPEHGQK